MLRPAHLLRGILAVSLCLLLIPITASAQNPDLSGTWTFNEEMSEVPDTGGRGFTRNAIELTITTDGNEITIEQKMPEPPAGQQGRGGRGMGGPTGPVKYVTDGKPVKESTERMDTVTTAEWKEGKLVIKLERTFSGREGQAMTMTTTTTYSMSDDGKQLTRIDESENPMRGGATTTKLVYDKKE